MPNIEVNGVDLYYEIFGEGVPLLFIAGLASDSQSWLPIVGDLSQHYQVITFDNRGSGRTKPMNVESGIHDIADDCIALIRYLGFSSVNLLGHSMGGFVALDCAIRYPEYVSKLIAVATSAVNSEQNNILFDDWASSLESGINPELWFKNIFHSIFSSRFFEDEEVVENAVRLSIEYPYPQTAVAFRNQVNAIKEFNCIDDLAGIKSKTMIMCGREDILFSPEESCRVLSAIPDTVTAVVEQAAHSVHMENPDEFVKLVQEFVNN